ncbi:MAG TPA: response regulator, partial [Spirochaetota bacterium]|nr:response regulator [Spirochaetota bacterium]
NRKAVGVVELLNKKNKKKFNKNDENLLNILANQIAILLENRNMLEELYETTVELKREKRNLKKTTREKDRLIEQLSHTYEELEKSQDENMTAAKFKGLGTLAAGVAHDFNNILASILSKCELCDHFYLQKKSTLKQPDIAVIKESLESIANLCLKTQHLTDSLIRLGKKNKKRMEAVNLKQLFNGIAATLKNQFAARGIKFKLKISPRLPRPMLDKGQLEDMITNLSLNALTAIEERQLGLRRLKKKEPSFFYSIEVERDKDELLMRFQDNGIGILSEHTEEIFEPYYSKHSQQHKSKHGLGLTMVRRIVDNHYGKISVSSCTEEMKQVAPDTYKDTEVGTCFTVRLPLVESRSRKIRSGRKTLSNDDYADALIYIADDEVEISEFFMEMLPEYGFKNVSIFKNGADMMTAVKKRMPDIIITDIVMPVMDGITFCRQLMEMKRADLPGVILATGKDEEKNIKDLKRLGINEVMRKPFLMDDLVERIKELLARKKDS